MKLNTNGKPHAPDPPAPRGPRALVLGGIVLGLICLAGGLVALALLIVNQPTFESVDAIDVMQIESMRVLIINRPDNGPDVGDLKGDWLMVPREECAAILAPLRKATRIDKERGVYLGEVRIVLIDGRKQTIMLSRVGSDATAHLRFKLGSNQYETASVDAFVQPAAALDDVLKGRR